MFCKTIDGVGVWKGGIAEAPPGTYLMLYHGRRPGEALDDWGEEGPTFGPLQFAHVTYASEIHLCPAGGADSVFDLGISRGRGKANDCVFLPKEIAQPLERYFPNITNMYYGDWSVFQHIPNAAR